MPGSVSIPARCFVSVRAGLLADQGVQPAIGAASSGAAPSPDIGQQTQHADTRSGAGLSLAETGWCRRLPGAVQWCTAVSRTA